MWYTCGMFGGGFKKHDSFLHGNPILALLLLTSKDMFVPSFVLHFPFSGCSDDSDVQPSHFRGVLRTFVYLLYQWLTWILSGIVDVVSSFQVLHASQSKPVEAEDNKDLVKQEDQSTDFKQISNCTESFHRMVHLVVEGIHTVLHQTRYRDNEDGDIRINWWQCRHLAHELLKMKFWLLHELQNLQTVSGATLACQHLLRVVRKVNVLVQESHSIEFNWLRAAVLQAGNEEAFVGILQDLKWCAHILNVTILSGKSSSEQIQSVGNMENLNWFEKDNVLGKRAILDKKELIVNLRGYTHCNSSFQKHEDAMRAYLLERCSKQASVQAVEEDLPVLLWDAQGDNALPLLEYLGKGSYGVVHKSTWLGLECAKKTFEAIGNTEFRKEAAILGSLKHPNITQLMCCTMDTNTCSLVMELMSTDLRKWMDKRMDPNNVLPFSLPVAVDIMLQVARGLKYMHEMHLAHRDIKPSNILVTPTPVLELANKGYVDVKLADFGQAKAKLMSSSTLQTPNIGTTQYRAPELFQVPDNCYTQDEEERIMKKIDPLKADVYSYAVTCAELLTGKCPYGEFPRTHLLSRILEGVRPSLPQGCPNHLTNLINRCWDTIPCNRPSISQVCNELMDFKTSSLIIEEKIGNNLAPQEI
ncbi:hypothetical protein BDL97_05G009900 [Sphagnum fallax]|nr:hypothetical protein BDL97_05G009900 [Sphagnum fallax]